MSRPHLNMFTEHDYSCKICRARSFFKIFYMCRRRRCHVCQCTFVVFFWMATEPSHTETRNLMPKNPSSKQNVDVQISQRFTTMLNTYVNIKLTFLRPPRGGGVVPNNLGVACVASVSVRLSARWNPYPISDRNM